MSIPSLITWIDATILIENDWGETGTGFLVQRMVDDQNARAFLITNKHVINSDPTLRKQAKTISIHVNMKESDGKIVRKSGVLPLQYHGGESCCIEHPDPDVDVLAINATNLIIHFPNLKKRFVSYSDIADLAVISENEITIGEEIMVIGYPVGLRQGPTNHPIVRSGIIATQIGTIYQDDVEENGKMRVRNIRGFLIDGATVPGSSGSPVILRPVIGRYVCGKIQLGIAPALLLGIVSETYYAPVQTNKWENKSFAGLGLVFDAITIKETIELYFQK